MPPKKASKFILTLFFAGLSASVLSAELDSELRTASQLYQTGRLDQARQILEKYDEFFPKNLELCLLMGRIEFEQKNYIAATNYFKIVDQQQPNHPLLRHYKRLLAEVNHRTGYSEGFTMKTSSQTPVKTAKEFKRGWFGPNFTNTSEPMKTPAPVPSAPMPKSPTYTVAPTALSTPHPPQDRILYGETISKMAEKALKDGLYIKAYLFYSQLQQSDPNFRSYTIGKSEAAFHMKRYKEVINMLGPLRSTNPDSFTSVQLEKVDQLLTESRKLIYQR